jgi:DNA mismatch repair protein MutL
MGKIIQLDSKLQNLIAAGEVVERVGNVVKELVENALDASSSQIDIVLEESGLKKIRIVDNGTGMDKDDAILAFNRHATSKIRSEYDLFHIASLGFRGEALPSIGAISRVELTTSTGDDEGTFILYQDGKLLSVSSAIPRKGTTIQITRLFYQTPARFKYLKSLSSELGFIQGLVGRFALGYPEVAFSLQHDGKLLFQTDGQNNRLSVIQKLYGQRTAQNMHPFVGQNRDYRIEGFFANPMDYRSSRHYQTILVNRRPIVSPRLSQAITDAFSAYIPSGKYPIVMIAIFVDPQLIDVNVHPTKQEVKFSEIDDLARLIKDTLMTAISSLVRIPEMRPYDRSDPSEEQTESLLTATHEEPTLFHMMESPVDNLNDYDAANRPVIPDLSYIGQYRGTYLIFQSQDGLYLMDQHAAAERIRYETYRQKMADPQPEIYQLLIPLPLELSPEIVSEFDQVAWKELTSIGIAIDSESPNSLIVKTVPAWFPRNEELAYAEAAIMTIIEDKTVSIAKIRDKLAKLLSCKHSLKANAFVEASEAEMLVSRLRQCQDPYICPHGRPTIVHFRNLEVEKWFKRSL